MKIRKAVIPAAGLGTRVLPASKAIPKEMLNIVDKPAIQYIVEEAVAAGITDILIITNRGKVAIEDHFDHSFELETMMKLRGGKDDILREVESVAKLANIYFLRQKETHGLGHAILCAEQFIGDEPFAILYGDDVIISEDPVIGQLCRAYDKYGKGVIGFKEVPREFVSRYCTTKISPLEEGIFSVTDMIEKPKPEQIMSCYSILGRCVLPPEIFSILKETPDGAGGELQLTDAMKVLSNRDGMIGVDFNGVRYDMGNKLGILQANIEVGLNHPEIGEDFKNYLKQLASKL